MPPISSKVLVFSGFGYCFTSEIFHLQGQWKIPKTRYLVFLSSLQRSSQNGVIQQSQQGAYWAYVFCYSGAKPYTESWPFLIDMGSGMPFSNTMDLRALIWFHLMYLAPSLQELWCPGIWLLFKRVFRAFRNIPLSFKTLWYSRKYLRLKGRTLCNSAFVFCSLKVSQCKNLEEQPEHSVAAMFRKPFYWNWTTT